MELFDIIIMGIPAVLIVALLIVFIWLTIKQRRLEKAGIAVKDERTAIMDGKAAYFTVIASVYFMLLLLYYVFISESLFEGLPVIDTAWYMIFALLFESVLFLALKYYFNSKEA